MQEKEHFLIGRVIRTHGLDGSLVVKLSEDVLLSNFPQYFVLSIRNQKVPWFIHHCESISRNSFIVKFDYINHQVDAKPLIGCSVYAEKQHINETKSLDGSDSSLIGFSVIDVQMGQIGTIGSFILNSPQAIMEVIAGEKTILIPAIEPIIISIDDNTKTVIIEAPAGLIDLYLHE